MNRLLALTLVLAVFVVACSGSDEAPASSALDGLIENAQPTAIVFDPNDPPELAGTSTNPSNLEAGDCFNEYLFRDASDFVQQVTTIVSCDGAHDNEAYFRIDFPAGENANYPLEDELERWADTTCLDEFEDFIGLDYVLSVLEIGAIVPTFERWSSDQDRAVICYVFPDQGGRLLDSVEGTGI